MISRYLGLGIGKLVAILNAGREQLSTASQNTRFRAIQQELRKGIHELDTIRSELRYAGSSPNQRAIKAHLDKPIGSTASMSAALSPAQRPPSSMEQSFNQAKQESAQAEWTAAHGLSDFDKARNRVRLGELAMAELMLQGEGSGIATMQRGELQGQSVNTQGAGPHGVQHSGSDVVQDVIFESLLRDHAERLSAVQQQQQLSLQEQAEQINLQQQKQLQSKQQEHQQEKHEPVRADDGKIEEIRRQGDNRNAAAEDKRLDGS